MLNMGPYFLPSNLALSLSNCGLLLAGNLGTGSGDFFGFWGRGGGAVPVSLGVAAGAGVGVVCVTSGVVASTLLVGTFRTGTEGWFCVCTCVSVRACVCGWGGIDKGFVSARTGLVASSLHKYYVYND